MDILQKLDKQLLKRFPIIVQFHPEAECNFDRNGSHSLSPGLHEELFKTSSPVADELW